LKNVIIRKLRYGFLFALHSNYRPILYYFRDKARYVGNRDFFTPSFHFPVRGHRRNIVITFGVENLVWCGYTKTKKVWWLYV